MNREAFLRGYMCKTAADPAAAVKAWWNHPVLPSMVKPDSWVQQHSPEVVKKGIAAVQQGVGRAITDTVEPACYTGNDQHTQLIKHPAQIIQAIRQDKPMYSPDDYNSSREIQYRGGFGLPPRPEMLASHAKDLIYLPDSGSGKAGDTPVHITPDLTEPSVMETMARNIPNPSSNRPNILFTPWAGHTDVAPGGTTQDPFDYELNPGEKPNSITNVLRLLVSPWVNPAVVQVHRPVLPQ